MAFRCPADVQNSKSNVLLYVEVIMKANELRLGNFVDNCGTECFVMGIYKDNKVELGYFTDSVGFVRSLDDKNINPITLTEEWLKRFGFKRFSKDFSKSGIIIHTRKRGFSLRKRVPDIKSVHQLQNLYFALTGQELEPKTVTP